MVNQHGTHSDSVHATGDAHGASDMHCENATGSLAAQAVLADGFASSAPMHKAGRVYPYSRHHSYEYLGEIGIQSTKGMHHDAAEHVALDNLFGYLARSTQQQLTWRDIQDRHEHGHWKIFEGVCGW